MEVVFSTREQKALKLKRNQIVVVILILIVTLMMGMTTTGDQGTLTDTLGRNSPLPSWLSEYLMVTLVIPTFPSCLC